MSLVPTLAGIVLLALAAWGAPALLLKLLAPRLARRTVRNYRGRDVYLGLGWAWVAWSAAVFTAQAVLYVLSAMYASVKGIWLAAFFAPTTLVVLVFALGWLDDRFGTAEYRGIRGHLSALRRGRVTTGLVKLVGIGVLALLWGIDAAGGQLIGGLLAAIVIAGAANLVNLTDLRPGRALKAYLVLTVLALAGHAAFTRVDGGSTPAAVLGIAVMLVGPALAIWPYDLGERGMLGDAGANAAGALVGYVLATSLPVPALGGVAVVLVALNLASERVSFSAVIERTGWLRRLDRLGRLPEEPGENNPA